MLQTLENKKKLKEEVSALYFKKIQYVSSGKGYHLLRFTM